MRFERAVVVALLLLCWAPPRADAAEVDAADVVKIILAALAQDADAADRFGEAVQIRLVGDGSRAEQLHEALGRTSGKTFRGLPIHYQRGNVRELAGQQGLLVFYTDSLGARAAEQAETCLRSRWTCIAAGRSDVAAGFPLGTAVGSDGRPRLLLNLGAARALNIRFQGAVMQVAEVVAP